MSWLRSGCVGLFASASAFGFATVGPVSAHDGEVHLRSVIERVSPETAFVAFDVIGDDAGLFVVVQPGVEFALPGYDGEPYLRAPVDGAMQVNVTSPTFFLNQDVFADVDVPEEFRDGSTVTWVDLPDRSFAFHDHRVHWMSPTPPTDEGRVFDWNVPFQVDGVGHELVGYLTTFDDEFSSNPFPPLVAGFAVGALTVIALWWRALRKANRKPDVEQADTSGRRPAKQSSSTTRVGSGPSPAAKPRKRSSTPPSSRS